MLKFPLILFGVLLLGVWAEMVLVPPEGPRSAEPEAPQAVMSAPSKTLHPEMNVLKNREEHIEVPSYQTTYNGGH